MPPDPPLPLVFTYETALKHGLSRHQIAHRARTGRWRRLQKGVYGIEQVLTAMSTRDQHVVAVQALLLARGDDVVASHLSAAVGHGWLLPLTGAGDPTVTAPSRSTATRRRGGFVVHVAGLLPRNVTTTYVDLAGERVELRCTAPARTLGDLLRHLPVPDAVAIADDVLRRGLVSYEQLARTVDEQALWPYSERARTALPMLDPRHETWLESYSFCVLRLWNQPRPEPQVVIHDERGLFVARVDGWLKGAAVALESDGRAKYLAGLGPLPRDVDAASDAVATTVRRHLLRQHERQVRLEDLGAIVVRWGTNDITAHPERVVTQVAAARRRGSKAAFTGRLTFQAPPPWLADELAP